MAFLSTLLLSHAIEKTLYKNIAQENLKSVIDYKEESGTSIFG